MSDYRRDGKISSLFPLHHRRCPGEAGGGAGVGGLGDVVPGAVHHHRHAQVLRQRVGVGPHVYGALVLNGDAQGRQVAVAVLLVTSGPHVEGGGVGDGLGRVGFVNRTGDAGIQQAMDSSTCYANLASQCVLSQAQQIETSRWQYLTKG